MSTAIRSSRRRPASNRRIRGLNAMLLGVWLVTLVACGSTPPQRLVNYYRSGETIERARRILVLPLRPDGQTPPVAVDDIQATMLSELTKLGLYDLVTIPPSEVPPIEGEAIRQRGTFAVDELIELTKRYRADGVLLASVTDYRPYPPLRLGVRAELISTKTGMVRWSADALFDANDRATRRSLTAYHDRNVASTDSLLAWEVLLVSMDRFTRFACHEVVSTLLPDGHELARH